MTPWRFVGTVRCQSSAELIDVDGTITRRSRHDALAALLLLVALGEWGTARPEDLAVLDGDGRVVEWWIGGSVEGGTDE